MPINENLGRSVVCKERCLDMNVEEEEMPGEGEYINDKRNKEGMYTKRIKIFHKYKDQIK